MRTLAALAVAAVALAAVLTGCLAPGAGVDPATVRPPLLPDLSDVPDPPMDAERGRLWWESFVRATPYRHAGTPTNFRASEMIRDELAANGYETRILYYLHPTGTPSPVDVGIRTVVGVKPGTEEPDRVVAWVAHYDANRGTIYAAYDDGSGTAVAMELARALKDYDNRKTLMVIFFDAEEIGLVASEYFVREALARGDVTYDLVIGHDMTGINCPGHEWRMYQFVGENYLSELKPVVQALYQQKLTPEENACVEFVDQAFRNSDERRFKEAGFPVIRMAGGYKATDYPEYHKPGDTVEFVYEFAGGEKNYEAGFALTVKASYWNVVAFDRLPSFTRAT